MGCFAQRSTPKTSVRSLGVGGAAASVPDAQISDCRLAMECDECQDPLEMLARAGRRVDADPNGIEEEVVGHARPAPERRASSRALAMPHPPHRFPPSTEHRPPTARHGRTAPAGEGRPTSEGTIYHYTQRSGLP